MSKFRYQPQIQDVLRKQMPHSVVEQLLRRDHSLEDYLDALPAPTGGGTGALTAKRDAFSGGITTLATDPTLSGGNFDWTAGSPNDGGVTLAFGPNTFVAAATGLYLIGMVTGFTPSAVGLRLTSVGTVDIISSGMLPAVVPPLGALMQVSVAGAAWLEAGDFFSPTAAQNSGGDLSADASITITQLVVA